MNPDFRRILQHGLAASAVDYATVVLRKVRAAETMTDDSVLATPDFWTPYIYSSMDSLPTLSAAKLSEWRAAVNAWVQSRRNTNLAAAIAKLRRRA